MLYSLHMVNDVGGEWVYYVWDTLREFLGYNFVSGLRTLKLKTLKTLKSTKSLKRYTFFLKKLDFPALTTTVWKEST